MIKEIKFEIFVIFPISFLVFIKNIVPIIQIPTKGISKYVCLPTSFPLIVKSSIAKNVGPYTKNNITRREIIKADFFVLLRIFFKNIHDIVIIIVIVTNGKIISQIDVKLILLSNNESTGKIPNNIGWNIILFNFIIYFEY